MIQRNNQGKFREILTSNGHNMADRDVECMADYVEKLLEWNKKINLISRASSDRIWIDQILHSVSPVLLGILPLNADVLDLGSGGGLPGIPVAIMRRDLNITLVDSIKKRTRVVEEIVAGLRLSNVRVATGRAEESKGLFGRFDIILARGVAPLEKLVTWSKLLLRSKGGRSLIAFKGGDITNEIAGATSSHKQLRVDVRDVTIQGAAELSSAGKKLVIVSL